MDCAQPRAHADFFGDSFVAADCDWLFAGSPAPLRSQHAFVTAKKHPCKSSPRGNHAKHACPLGAGVGNRSRKKSAATLRLLAKNLRALATAPGSRQNQKLFHARGALPVTNLDAVKSTTIEHDQFPSSARDFGADAGCRRIQSRLVRAGVHAARRITTC